MLERLGVPCWLAERDVNPGEPFDEEIVRAIHASKAFVLLLSDAANVSAHVKRELGLATENGLAVYPIRIQEVQPGAKLQYLLQGTQWVDAWTPPLEAHLGRVAELIVGWGGERTRADSAPAPVVRSPVRTRSWLAWAGAGIVLTALASGWLVLTLRDRATVDGQACGSRGRVVVAQPAATTPTPSARLPGMKGSKSWTNSLGLVFVPVEGTPVAFSIWDTRVQDYEAFTGETKRSWTRPAFQQGPTHPAVNVTWADAKAFCAWMTLKEQQAGILDSSFHYRLPSDAEWSTAVGLTAEAGATPGERHDDPRNAGTYPWGGTFPPLRGAGNYAQTLQADDFETTSPVGSFSANRFGLYDMGGNVWQWCEDQRNPKRDFRVIRGGSWSAERAGACSAHLLSSCRGYVMPNGTRETVGFRCVLAAAVRDDERAGGSGSASLPGGRMLSGSERSRRDASEP